MNRILAILLISLFIYGCNNYEDKYEITVGETVEIYYSTNSCCYYCLSNEKDLKHVKLLETKTIDSSPEDCAGCNYTAAFVFKAESVGIDTIELKLMGGTMDCDSNDVKPEKYIVDIK